jgi:GTP-binding protein LepA
VKQLAEVSFLCRYRESQLVKLDIQINGDPVEALSTIVHRDKVLYLRCYLCIELSEKN